jgi:acetate kinase
MGSILVLNAGSSSIKFASYACPDDPALAAPLRPCLHGQVAWHAGPPAQLTLDVRSPDRAPLHQEARLHEGEEPATESLDWLMQWLAARETDPNFGGPVIAVGHRVVHGGPHFSQPVRVDEATRLALQQLCPLAPLHQPHNLAAIAHMQALHPELPQVACFDTAFHAQQPFVERALPLPRSLTAQGLRRYGFHGLSYTYIAQTLPTVLGERAQGRVIVAHLGNGASLCAMKGCQSVASTMGFSALDGLMMGTRTGSIDPGVLLYLMQTLGMDAKALTHLLYAESGLLGVSGLSADMAELLKSDRPEAAEAVDLFTYRVVKEIGGLSAVLGGLDALVFTAGIGEHAVAIRARVVKALSWMGVQLDEAANARHDLCISLADSPLTVLVLPTDEEAVLAQQTRVVLFSAG